MSDLLFFRMGSQFESKLQKALDEFYFEIQKIKNGVPNIPKSKTEFKNVTINQSKLKNSFKQIFKDKNDISKIGKNLQLHFVFLCKLQLSK